ncbi:MAG: M23 family metallopeptidase [Defluviitaleaceae bacterium]|nr:M23 family metallopeptidase [Defluviitaleaceae bacterium]MCL2275280.1 M23 family metallopeptidase [Defluviitaleaceae bacterium]
MQTWMGILLIILSCRIVSIVLRRFKAGGIILVLASKLFWLFPLGILGSLIGNSTLALFHHSFFLIFLSTPLSVFIQSLYQLVGDTYVKILHKNKLPSMETYTQKGSYILPFTGKWTVFNGGVNENLLHGGSASQKYAYDFIIANDEGKSFEGNGRSVQNYFCYGKEVLAPADGIVVKVRRKSKDSFVDGVAAYCDSLDLRGNYVVIKHHDKEYSLVAHLAPNSITVNTGDNVKQGEVIARCGNTGNTSEPHIHFQLQTGKSFFLSAGLPIAFTNITAQDKGNYSLMDTRPYADNLQVMGNFSYIGRGLEVENAI